MFQTNAACAIQSSWTSESFHSSCNPSSYPSRCDLSGWENHLVQCRQLLFEKAACLRGRDGIRSVRSRTPNRRERCGRDFKCSSSGGQNTAKPSPRSVSSYVLLTPQFASHHHHHHKPSHSVSPPIPAMLILPPAPTSLLAQLLTAALTVALTSVLARICSYIWRSKRADTLLASVPGPKGTFLLGSIPDVLRNLHRVYDHQV